MKYTQTAPPSEGTSFRPSERAEYNEVYVNAIISLNRYGFFDTFAGEMSPMVNSVLIYIECDDNVIFKAIAV